MNLLMKRFLLFTMLIVFSQAQGPDIVVDDLSPEPAIMVPPIIISEFCELDLMNPDRDDFYGLMYGMMQGLYKTENYPTKEGCKICLEMALPFANMQSGLALILELAGDLFSADGFASLSASERMKKLYSAFMFFWEFAVNLDALYQSEHTKVLYIQMMHTISEDFKGQQRNNIFEHFMGMVSMVSTMDIADCTGAGVRGGALLRYLFGFEFVLP